MGECDASVRYRGECGSDSRVERVEGGVRRGKLKASGRRSFMHSSILPEFVSATARELHEVTAGIRAG